MTQRNGRIIRQGNMNKEVKVFNYVTEGTFDSYLYQTLENKQRFISQIMTSKSPVRSCEDVDEQALSYAEIKALCAGNPLIKEKMDLDVQVAKLKVLKADHQSQKFRLQDKLLTKFPADIQETNAHIAGLKADAQLAVGAALADDGLHSGHDLSHTGLIVCTQQGGAVGGDESLALQLLQEGEGGGLHDHAGAGQGDIAAVVVLVEDGLDVLAGSVGGCLLYTSPSPRDS